MDAIVDGVSSAFATSLATPRVSARKRFKIVRETGFVENQWHDARDILRTVRDATANRAWDEGLLPRLPLCHTYLAASGSSSSSSSSSNSVDGTDAQQRRLNSFGKLVKFVMMGNVTENAGPANATKTSIQSKICRLDRRVDRSVRCTAAGPRRRGQDHVKRTLTSLSKEVGYVSSLTPTRMTSAPRNTKMSCHCASSPSQLSEISGNCVRVCCWHHVQ